MAVPMGHRIKFNSIKFNSLGSLVIKFTKQKTMTESTMPYQEQLDITNIVYLRKGRPKSI